MIRWVRAVAAVLVLLLLLAGLPLLLVVAIGDPRAGWADLWVGDVSDRAVLDVLAGAAWLAWARFVFTVAAEGIALIGTARYTSRRGQSRLRPVSPAANGSLPAGRLLARTLLAAALFTAPLAAPMQALAVTTTSAGTPAPTPLTSARRSGHDIPGAEQSRVWYFVVQDSGPGTLWDLAHRYLGDGDQWTRLWQLNKGRVQDDGTRMVDPGLLRPGWTVAIPAARTSPTHHAPAAITLQYTVAPGDRLEAIARRFLGDRTAYPRIRAANPQYMPHRDGPDHLRTGWLLNLPAGAHDRGPVLHAAGRVVLVSPKPRQDRAPATTTSRAPASPTPTRIPAPTAGPAGSAVDAADASRGIPGGWADLALAVVLLTAAVTLWMRRRLAVMYPAQADIDPSKTRSDIEGDQADENAPTASATVSTARQALYRHAQRLRERTPTSGHRRDGVPGPADRERTPATRTAKGLTVRTEPSSGTAATGTGVAGGPGRARAAGAGQTRSRLPSSAGRPPGFPDRERATAHHDATVTPLRSGRAAQPPADGAQPVGPARGETLQDVVVAQEVDLLAAGVTGLIGPGAAGAVRALLVTAVSATAPGPGGTSGEVLITAGALHDVLPDIAGREITSPRLVVAADLEQALHFLGHTIALRRQLLAHHRLSSHTPPAATDTGPAGALFAPLLVITQAPAGPSQEALDRQAANVAGLRIDIVVLGPWPPGRTLAVAGDGALQNTVTQGQNRRNPDRPEDFAGTGPLQTLDAATSADLLRVLAGPYPLTGQSPPAPTTGGDDQQIQPPREPEHPADRSNAPVPGTAHGLHLAGAAADTGERSPAPEPDQQTSSRVRIRLLGPVEVIGGDGSPVPGLRRGATELLVYLAVHRKGAALPVIMEALFPDATVPRAKDRLSTEVAALRRTIRIAAGRPDIEPVVNTGGHYHLAPDLLDLDLWQVTDHLQVASSTGDPHQRVNQIRQAVHLTGDVLAEGATYEWIDPHRENLRRLSIQARLALADDPTTSPSDSAVLTGQAADLDPTSDELARRDMKTHAALADTNAVHRRLYRLRTALKEISETPDPTTLALAASLTRAAQDVVR